MRTIGVDPATKTGIAVAEDGKIVHTSTLKSKLKGMPRVSDLAQQLCEVYAAYPPSLVLIEGYGFANAHTLVPLVEIGTVLRYFTLQLGLTYWEIPPTSLKKFVSGKGNSKKEVMLLEVFKRWGLDGLSNDEADAVGLAMFGQAAYGIIELPKLNMSAVEVILAGNQLQKNA